MVKDGRLRVLTDKEMTELLKVIEKDAKKMDAGSASIYRSRGEDYYNLIVLKNELAKAANKAIEDGDTLVTKEYVKGRGNIYTNPIFKEIDQQIVTANKTAETMQKIKTAALGKIEPKNDDGAELLRFVAGRRD